MKLTHECRVLRKDEPGDEGGYKPADEFEKTVLDDLASRRAEMAKMTEDVGNLHGDTKKALEEMTTAKNRIDGLDSSMNEFALKFKRARMELANERRYSFGSPKERILSDPKKRRVINALVRATACRQNPELGSPTAEDLEIAKEFADYEKSRAGLVSRAAGDTPALTYIDDDLYT
ncbi:MAG: hypothetical protein ACR2QM_07465, partial [Longimicrobiales bacterium]